MLLSMPQMDKQRPVFEWEVFLILEQDNFLIANDSRPSSSFDLHPEYAAFIARYVLLRPYQEDARWNDNFPALINEVVDTIIRLRPQTAALRTQMITTLCHRSSLHLLVRKPIGDASRRDFKEHLLVAATHLKQLSVLAELLCLQTDLSQTHSDYFGTPVQAAIATNDANLVRRFLLHGAKFEYPGWLKDVVRAPNAPRLLAVFATHQECQSILRTSIRDVTNAIGDAAELGKEDVAMHLLDTQREAFGHGSLAYYLRNPFLSACERGMVQLVPRLIEAAAYAKGHRWTGPPLRKLVTATCAAGQASTLGILLEKTKQLKNAVPVDDFLLPCVRTGTMDTLCVLLDAGATLSAVAAMQLLASIAPWPPMDEAKCGVLQRTCYLLQRKAVHRGELLTVEEHTGFGVAHCMMVAAQRGNFALLEALARFGVPVDDQEFYAKAGCAVPIVAAEAFGREETARKIKLLVVKLGLEAEACAKPWNQKKRLAQMQAMYNEAELLI
ncbi:uncharacterized protein N0V89_000408 [Didymosphaeria variabile]|uniref:Ankyrin n=1 Tax=Didymosphaeria variabile TaxID=1932322 RepID=A0A9W9CFP9_9PLEO|nr:uncharacterized protein N0V89_000408 [Didymosphaeria variabile]KAJ4359852.1 hypothetical protein N0V89_000408 [Didymosphaeria variabile]